MDVKKADGAGIVDAAMVSISPTPLEIIRGLYKANSEGTAAALIEAVVGLIGKGLLNRDQLKRLIEAAVKAL